MMDVSPYFLAAVALGLPAYAVAVVLRRSRQLRENRKRAADSLAVANHRADRIPGTLRGTYPGANSDSDDDGGTLGTVNSHSGRRAIHRPNGWARFGRYAAGRHLRGADETALA